MSIPPIPPGYHAVTPYLTVRNAKEALSFYIKAFGAEPRGELIAPDGTIMHGEMQIGDSFIMFCEENLEMGMKGPQTLGGAGITLCLYVENVDAVFTQAVSAGAEVVRPVEDQFWGDRAGTVADPFGHNWTIMTHIESLEWEEVQQRFEQMFAANDD